MIFFIKLVGGLIVSATGPMTLDHCLARVAVEQVVAQKGTTYKCESYSNHKELK
jgi:hypothetical protein